MRKIETEYIESSLLFHGAASGLMGTRLEMIAAGCSEEDARTIWDWLVIEGFHLDSILDRFKPESELSRLVSSSVSEYVPVSQSFALIFRVAERYRELTGGYFDVAMGDSGRISMTQDDRIRLGGARLDFGGFAKGYLLRMLSERIKGGALKSAFIDFGGSSILTVGHHPYGDRWKVGVRNPYGPGILSEVELKDNSMSTSGNSPRYGSHIVNPFTGNPVEDSKAVNVVCPDPLDAEVLSTTLMMVPEEEAEAMAGRFPGACFRIFKCQTIQ